MMIELTPAIVRWYGKRATERLIRSLYDVAKKEDPGALVSFTSFPTTEHLDLPFLDVCTFNVYLHDRPAFSSAEPHWLLAGAVGTTVALTAGSRITARALVAADTAYEPRLPVLADYAASWSRRFQTQISVANSSSDEQFAFTSVAVTASWLMTPSVGLSVIANHRMQTFERSEMLFGIVVRR